MSNSHSEQYIVESWNVVSAINSVPKIGSINNKNGFTLNSVSVQPVPRTFWAWLFRKPYMWRVECKFTPIQNSEMELTNFS